MNDATINAAIDYIRELFQNNSGGHDAAHSLRVYRNAMRIAESEPGCDRDIVALTALLHDADDHKLFHTEQCQRTRVSGQTVCRRGGNRADLPRHQRRIFQPESRTPSRHLGGKNRAGRRPARRSRRYWHRPHLRL